MPEDEATVPETAPDSAEEPAAPEADPDSTMEVADAETVSDLAATEVGTAVVPESEPVADPTPDPLDNPDAGHEVVKDGGDITVESGEEEEEDEDEPSLAEKQANFEPPRVLDQASHVQGLMVAGANAGQAQRRETLARNRERRAQQHKAIHLSDQG